MTSAIVLSTRTLNRTLLQRQFLTARTPLPALDVVAHLVAMQGQEPNWPYVGLWTRLAAFRHDDLAVLLEDRRVVRGTTLRGTQHLMSDEDFLGFRPVVQPVLDRLSRGRYLADGTAGLDPAEIVDAGRDALTGRELTRRRLAVALAERFPGGNGRLLAAMTEMRTPLVHAPSNGAWGSWGTRTPITVGLAEERIGRPMAERGAEALIERYLAAFGPAGVKDFQTWSGLTRTRGVFDAMRSRLRVFRDEHGVELFDLPDAPRADPDTPAPVRFLPAYDNVILGHADRTRILGDEDRRRVMPGHSLVLPTLVVDGFVHGTWALKDAGLTVTLFRPLSREDTDAVLAEGERLLRFLVPDAAVRGVTLDG